MKKILLVLSLVIMMFFVGCSAADNMTNYEMYISSDETAVSDNSYLYYDTNYFIMNGLSETDLINYFIVEEDTFEIYLIYYETQGWELNESLNGIIDKLYAIAEVSPVTFRDLLDYTATDLNTLANSKDITLTVDDIVGFHDLVDFYNNLNRFMSISRLDYINLALQRELTDEEIEGLNELNDAYEALTETTEYNLLDKTFMELEADLLENNYLLTETELISLEIGYNIVRGFNE